MVKTKTSQTSISVADFIESYVENEQKRADSFRLLDLMGAWSGYKATMWGPTIIGFGSYHYAYASGHQGDAPLLGFSPRKAAFSLYVYSPIVEQEQLLKSLGKFKKGKACLYVKRISDIRLDILEELCTSTIAYFKEHRECACRAN